MDESGEAMTDEGATAAALAETSPKADKRRYDIDILRILAAFAVILLHTGGELLRASQGAVHSTALYWTGLSADTLGRFAVPVFFAMAGWVLLSGAPPRDSAALMRRVWRVVVPLAIWTVVYIAIGHRGIGDGSAAKLAVDSLFGQIRPAYHLWYLYQYIPCLVLLGAVVLLLKRKSAWMPMAALAAIAAIPVVIDGVQRVTGWTAPPLTWGVGLSSLLYALGGGALLAARPLRRLWALLLFAAGLAGTLAWQHLIHFPVPYGALPVAVLSAGAVLLGRGVTVPDPWKAAVVRVSNATFGAYLVHLLILQALSAWLLRPGMGWLGSLGALAAITVGTASGALGLSMLWGRVPLLRRLLG